MKAIFNYFKQRRERRLRMWCISQVNTNLFGIDTTKQAQNLYDWVASDSTH